MTALTLTDRQAAALQSPLDSACGSIDHLRTIHHVGQGEMLVIILAVDR